MRRCCSTRSGCRARRQIIPEKGLDLLLDAVGLPREAFMPVFAVARGAGWLAHAMEQQREGRLVRPSSSYVGPAPKGVASPA